MHVADATDLAFADAFESGALPPAAFDHEAHLRLAYVYLTRHPPDEAHARMKDSLLGYLAHHGIDPAKYHETLTFGWVRAVHAFMGVDEPAPGFAEFLASRPRLLLRDLLEHHYSPARLHGHEARGAVLAPDRRPFPA